MRARLWQRAPAVVQRATVWGLGLPRPLLVVLLLGVAVRVGLFVLLPDGILHNNDSAAYLSNGFFDDPRQPSGYYFVLALLRAVDDSLWPIYVAQHLLGLGGGLLVYLAGREIGLRPLGAAIAALPLLVGSEQLYLEHTVLAEGIFVVEFAAVLFLALRALRGGPGWWAATGAVLGYAALTRSIGVPLAVDAFPLDRDPQAGDGQMAEFASRAIRAQPIDYATTVLTDLARYVRWDIDGRPDAGSGPWALDVSLRVPAVEATVARLAQAKYPGTGPPAYRGEKALAFYASAAALAAPLLLALVALTLLAAFKRSPWRRAAWLCLLMAAVLMVVPVATLIYNQRYAVPAYPPLALGGVLGACLLLGRGLDPPASVTGLAARRAGPAPPAR